MSTSVATLQSRIVAHFGATVGDEHLSQADLLGDINQVYQFDIPDVLGDGRFRELAIVTVPASTATRVDLNTATVTPTAPWGPILGTWARYRLATESFSTKLNFYTSERDFWEANDPAVTAESRPTDILVLNDGFYLRPIPSASGLVTLDALKYRAALLQAGSITLDFEAKAIEYAAAAYAATRIGDDDSAARLNAIAGPVFDKLRSLMTRSARVPIVARNF